MNKQSSAQDVTMFLTMAFCMALLAWPLFNNPPYGFYSALRATTVVGGIGGAYYIYNKSSYLLPLTFFLLVISGVFAFGKMHRSEWIFYDWAAIALLGTVLVTASVSFLRRK